MLPTNFGDDTEGASVVASLGDLDVGHVLRGKPEPWCRVVGNAARLFGDCVKRALLFEIPVESLSDNRGYVCYLI